MKTNIKNSQIANDGSSITGSKINVSYSKIRRETIIISFIVGFLSSILASYIYNLWIK